MSDKEPPSRTRTGRVCDVAAAMEKRDSSQRLRPDASGCSGAVHERRTPPARHSRSRPDARDEPAARRAGARRRGPVRRARGRRLRELDGRWAARRATAAGSWCSRASRGSASRGSPRASRRPTTPGIPSSTDAPTRRASRPSSRSSRRCATTRHDIPGVAEEAGLDPRRPRRSWRGSCRSSARRPRPPSCRIRRSATGAPPALRRRGAAAAARRRQRSRLLLVLEDLHWADVPTLLLLRQLLRSGAGVAAARARDLQRARGARDGPAAPARRPAPRGARGHHPLAGLDARGIGGAGRRARRARAGRRRRRRSGCATRPAAIPSSSGSCCTTAARAALEPAEGVPPGRQGPDRAAAGSALARGARDAHARRRARLRLPTCRRCRWWRTTMTPTSVIASLEAAVAAGLRRRGRRGGRPLLLRARPDARDALRAPDRQPQAPPAPAHRRGARGAAARDESRRDRPPLLPGARRRRRGQGARLQPPGGRGRPGGARLRGRGT